MLPETILGEPEFQFLVSGLLRVLRKPEAQPNDHRHACLAEIKISGLDAEEPTLVGGVVTSTRYAGLIDALVTHKPDPSTGEIEGWQIVAALGEHGNIWPVDVLADREELAHLEGPAIAA